MEWKPALQGTYSPNMNAFWRVAVEIWTFGKLEYKTLSQCDGNADADADNWGDCNSSPCTSYRRAKNDTDILQENILPMICQLELLAAVETRVLIGSAFKMRMQPFPHSSDATHKIWSRLTNLPQRHSSLKVWTDDGWTADHQYTISSPYEPSAKNCKQLISVNHKTKIIIRFLSSIFKPNHGN